MSDNRFSEDISKGTNTASSETAEQAARAALDGEDVEEAQLNIRLPKPLHEAFKRRANAEARQMSALVRKWIREYVRKDE